MQEYRGIIHHLTGCIAEAQIHICYRGTAVIRRVYFNDMVLKDVFNQSHLQITQDCDQIDSEYLQSGETLQPL